MSLTEEEIEARIEAAIEELTAWAVPARSAAVDKAFAEWLMDTDTPAYARSYLATIDKSNCALVIRKYLRLLGLTDMEITVPYARRDTLAVSDIGVIGRRYGAWVSSALGLSAYPIRGDVIAMSLGAEHVALVLGTRADDGAVVSLDGGQAKEGVRGGGSVVGTRFRDLIAPEKGMPFLREHKQPELLVLGGKERTLYGRIDVRTLLKAAA